MDIAPLLLASVVGFGHAFEADHLVAVSNIVTRRNNPSLAIKDGIYWGLGHTSTILLVGCIILMGKFALETINFHYFEAGVGLMLILLGFYRLYKTHQSHKSKAGATTQFRPIQPENQRGLLVMQSHTHADGLRHSHGLGFFHSHGPAHEHKLAYGVGLIHGLAGSGALILSVLTTIQGTVPGLLYLIIFGLGSIAGMMVAAGLFSIPFSEKLTRSASIRLAFTVASSLLCIVLGGSVVYENLI